MCYWQDIRYALRLLRKDPLFTLLTVVVLAGGLGLSIFTFSFLHTAMLAPLPVARGASLVRLVPTRGGASTGMIDAADLAFMRPSITTLREVGVYRDRELVVGTGDATRTIDATEAEWNVFAVTGTPPALGRSLNAADQAEGAEPVIVLSHRTWQAVFGGDPAILNTTVRLGGRATRVIGVMPAGYAFPVASEAWLPLPAHVLATITPGHELVLAYGHLAPGADRARATAELTGLLGRARSTRPVREESLTEPDGMTVSSFPLAQIGDNAPLVLAVLNAIAFLILLLACVNVTHLLLARANERARETAVRLALGAPRARLILQSMWESILLCVMGGALATALAVWGLESVNGWAASRLEGHLAFWWDWGFDRSVLLAAGAFVTVAMAMLGGVASRRAVDTAINAVLQEGGARGGARREGRVARTLVIAQVATVSILLFFGTLSVIVAGRVVNVRLGYDTRHLLSATLEPPLERYPEPAERGRFFQAVYDGLAERRELAGVLLRVPLADMHDAGGVVEPAGAIHSGPQARAYVTALLGPLSTLGVGLREGRFFDGRDVAGTEPVVLVSEALARRHWPGRSPVGEPLRLSGLEEDEARTVVGVVGDVLLGNPLGRDRSALAAYVPLRQADARAAAVVFRHRGSEPAARAAFHETMASVDPQVVPSNIASFEEVLGKSAMLARSVTGLFGGCFAFALLLAVTGIHGLMARSIGRRTREIGVRRALGATDGVVLGMLLGEGGRQLGIGALAALPVMLAVGWGFSRYFPLAPVVTITTAVLVTVAIGGIVIAATWAPTRRALAIEPRDALWRD